MLKKLSLRMRLTILSVILLTACCICLTITLNLSANRMADVIEAVPVVPAGEIGVDGKVIQGASPTLPMETLALSETSQNARNKFLNQSIFYVLFIVAMGGGLTYYLSGKALKPLQELSSQMKNRTVHNLSESLPIPESRDEIADLTVAFNEMSGKLDEAFATQKRFSQSAAHELRTPLTVLKTKVDVFKKKPEHTAEEYDKLLLVLTTHTNRLSDLVKDLLELTNMDAMDCSEQIQLKSMLAELSVELADLAKDKNVVITILGEEQKVMGNRSLLHRAFYNLLENAIKYNVENGKIEITIREAGESVAVELADTGIGIPTELQEHIFEPFFRVDKSRSRQMGGAGLGLSTVKAVVSKHCGGIEVSENPGGGTVFTVTL